MTPIQRRILKLMLRHIADEAGVPTLTWVARQLGRSKPVVFRQLRKMADAGVVKMISKRGAWRRYIPANVCPTCGRLLESP